MKTEVVLAIVAVILSLQPAMLRAKKHKGKLGVCSVSTVMLVDFADIPYEEEGPDPTKYERGDSDLYASEKVKFEQGQELKRNVESMTWLKVIFPRERALLILSLPGSRTDVGVGTLGFSFDEGPVYSESIGATGKTGSDFSLTLTLKNQAGDVIWQNRERSFEGIRSYADSVTARAYEDPGMDLDKARVKLLKKLGEEGHGCGKR